MPWLEASSCFSCTWIKSHHSTLSVIPLVLYLLYLCAQQVRASSISSEWFFLSVGLPVISPPHLFDPHTVSAARHWITSWWGVCLLRDGYEFFIFMPSKFPSFPCSPNYLLFHASFFLLIFSPWSFFYLPYISCFSPRCSGFISLFRDGETILHAWLELKQLSEFQTNTETKVCLGVVVCVWTWDNQNSCFWEEVLKTFHRKKTRHHFTKHPHTCKEPGNDSQRPLPFDVWLLCEWWASWGLVDLRPPSVYLADGRGERAWEIVREGGNQYFSYKLNNRFKECICQ